MMHHSAWERGGIFLYHFFSRQKWHIYLQISSSPTRKENKSQKRLFFDLLWNFVPLPPIVLPVRQGRPPALKTPT